MPDVAEALFELFRAHGVEAAFDGEWVSFQEGRRRAAAAVVQEFPQSVGMSVQMDVRLEIEMGIFLVESFGGIGETRDRAVADALHAFMVNSLHVLLAAFFGAEDNQQVSREEWEIGGKRRPVTLGGVGGRGTLPGDGSWLEECLGQFREALAAQRLGPEVHWVRLYYAQAQGKPFSTEVLLDNEPWEQMQEAVSDFPWPSAKEFYSIRLFLVIGEIPADPKTPEGAVSLLVRFVHTHPEATDDAVYEAMARAGVPNVLAGRALNFTQSAWGRVVLAGLEIRFAPDYVCCDAHGNLREEGLLAQEPSFVAATRICPRYLGSPAFKRLSASSADVQAVSKALYAGATPESLKGGSLWTPCLFLEPPTQAGLEKAQQTLAARRTGGEPGSSRSLPPPRNRSWWPFGRR